MKESGGPFLSVWFMKLRESATLPTYGTPVSACMDLYLPQDTELIKGQVKHVPLGLIARVDPQFHLQIYIRSSMAKQGITLANSVGIIDSDYCGPEDELGLLLLYHGPDESKILQQGTRVAQMRPAKNIQLRIKEVKDVGSRSRGGFGSTGK